MEFSQIKIIENKRKKRAKNKNGRQKKEEITEVFYRLKRKKLTV